MKLLGTMVGMALGLSVFILTIAAVLGVVLFTLDVTGILPLLVRMWGSV